MRLSETQYAKFGNAVGNVIIQTIIHNHGKVFLSCYIFFGVLFCHSFRKQYCYQKLSTVSIIPKRMEKDAFQISKHQFFQFFWVFKCFPKILWMVTAVMFRTESPAASRGDHLWEPQRGGPWTPAVARPGDVTSPWSKCRKHHWKLRTDQKDPFKNSICFNCWCFLVEYSGDIQFVVQKVWCCRTANVWWFMHVHANKTWMIHPFLMPIHALHKDSIFLMFHPATKSSSSAGITTTWLRVVVGINARVVAVTVYKVVLVVGGKVLVAWDGQDVTKWINLYLKLSLENICEIQWRCMSKGASMQTITYWSVDLLKLWRKWIDLRLQSWDAKWTREAMDQGLSNQTSCNTSRL